MCFQVTFHYSNTLRQVSASRRSSRSAKYPYHYPFPSPRWSDRQELGLYWKCCMIYSRAGL